MDFALTDEQALLQRTAREALAAIAPMTHVRAMMADERGTTDAVWRQLGALGWPGMIVRRGVRRRGSRHARARARPRRDGTGRDAGSVSQHDRRRARGRARRRRCAAPPLAPWDRGRQPHRDAGAARSERALGSRRRDGRRATGGGRLATRRDEALRAGRARRRRDRMRAAPCRRRRAGVGVGRARRRAPLAARERRRDPQDLRGRSRRGPSSRRRRSARRRAGGARRDTRRRAHGARRRDDRRRGARARDDRRAREGAASVRSSDRQLSKRCSTPAPT